MGRTVAVSGTRLLAIEDRPRLYQVLLTVSQQETLLTGACVGVDTVMAQMAYTGGWRVFTVVPANRSQVDPSWSKWCSAFEIMPPSPEPYRARNERLIQLADRLIAFPAYVEDDPRSRRSGTWMTIHLAEQYSVPTDIYVLRR